MENKHLDNNQTLSEALWNACLLHHFKYGVPHSLSLSPQLRVTESLHASGRASAGTVWQLSHRGYESWPACGARCPPLTLLLYLQPFPISIRSHRARARGIPFMLHTWRKAYAMCHLLTHMQSHISQQSTYILIPLHSVLVLSCLHVLWAKRDSAVIIRTSDLRTSTKTTLSYDLPITQIDA